jgi:hypothetical protein
MKNSIKKTDPAEHPTKHVSQLKALMNLRKKQQKETATDFEKKIFFTFFSFDSISPLFSLRMFRAFFFQDTFFHKGVMKRRVVLTPTQADEG